MLPISRREMLYGLGASLGSVALTSLLGNDLVGRVAASGTTTGAMGDFARLPAKATQCIFLMMEGGPSHIDTFDPKPKLNQLHLQEFRRQGETKSAMESGKRYYVESPFLFERHGASGAAMATNWRHLKNCADDICFYRGMQVDSVNHPTALYQVNTGNRFGGDPSVGAWVTYGLGTLNENLPAFVVLPEISYPQGGPSNWGAGFLPAHYQATPFRPKGPPILDLSPMDGITRQHQQQNLNFLNLLNAEHARQHSNHGALEARMRSYELAFKMQTEIPELLDVDREPEAIRRLYGLDGKKTHSFGKKCLLARRLVERGVRFVQLYAGSWDSHDYIARAHGNLVEQVDQPIAALLMDLKQRGLLDSTLVVWCGEFGRSPDNGVRGGTAYGRDHNSSAMTLWMAGGGVNAGHTIGATDETGAEAVECVHHVRDFHVTMLRLLGLDDNQLTYFHAGRFKQLSQFGGTVIDDLIG